MARSYLVLGEILFVAILCAVAFVLFRQHPAIANAVHADIKLADTKAQVYLQRDAAGRYQYFIWHPGGATDKVTAEQLSDQLYRAGASGGIAPYLGTASRSVLIWLGVGLFGQVLFTGRMVVQWIASERKGSSIVPPMFWWMSLVGSLLLLAYFLWRRDPIGLLGQAFGSFVYLRNILWILEGRQPTPVAAAEAAEPMTQG
ncbi:MAG: lipid-A-disaccharide synthase N-terminal domain-containing protein [Tepidisphaeraceae bacterium]